MTPTTRNWQAGAALALSTAVTWGALPIGLKVALAHLDAWTVTWWRFVGAAAIIGAWLGRRGRLPAIGGFRSATWRWLAIATVGLAGNYMLYVIGLDLTAPAVAQVVIQLAPLLFLLAGVIVFRERFSGWQWLGCAILVAGILLFFNRRLPLLLQLTDRWTLGVISLVVGAVSWAVYGVAQKLLARELGSLQTLWLLFIACAIVLLPATTPAAVLDLDGRGLAALAFCILNSVLGYGCFGFALERWDVTRVSAVASTAPLFTLAFMATAAKLEISWIQPEPINTLAVIGALLVVAGSTLAALASRRG
jgi:drug/metabolite transporter (DMT)-like permease